MEFVNAVLTTAAIRATGSPTPVKICFELPSTYSGTVGVTVAVVDKVRQFAQRPGHSLPMRSKLPSVCPRMLPALRFVMADYPIMQMHMAPVDAPVSLGKMHNSHSLLQISPHLRVPALIRPTQAG